MRKITILLVILALVFSMAACNGSGGDSNETTTAATTAAAETTTADSTDDNGSETDANDDQTAELSGVLEIAGSTSVAPLAQDLADAFMAIHQDVTINIQSIGSSAGVRAPVDGAAEIGMSSRNLKDEEKEWGLTEYIVAIDGIAVVVHPDNTAVEALTLDQLKQIYVGEITNWSEVGGDDAEIVVVSREEGSGTRGAFEEIVGYEGELRVDAVIGDGNGNVKSNLITNKNAIAYLSLGYVDDETKLLKIDGFEGTVENIVAGDYPVSRPFIMIALEDVNELGSAYLDFVLSEAGQEIVSEKYIAVS